MEGESSRRAGIGTESPAGRRRGTSFVDLPDGCIVKILSLTTPIDACRLSMVSPSFRSSANSDALWERFLPSDYHSITLSPSAAPPSSFPSKKALFRSLCSRPTAFDGGNKSMWLEKESGKKCYQLAAGYRYEETSSNGGYWIKTSGSRFVCMLTDFNDVMYDLDIRLEIATATMMSPATTYAAYLVYSFQSWRCVLLNGSFGVPGNATAICLNPSKNPELHNHGDASEMLGLKRAKIRRDGLLEMELGRYFN